MRIDKMITKEDVLIFYQILSTNSCRKCAEVNLENWYEDVGLKTVSTYKLQDSPSQQPCIFL